MKCKQFLIIVLSLWVVQLFGQSYSLTTSTGIYKPLEESISLNDSLVWDDPQFTVPIGFDFQYGGQNFNEIFLEDVGLGGLVTSDTSETGIIPVIVVYGVDIIDRGFDFVSDTAISQSNISYQLVGMEGSRILKIEWNNVGFFDELSGDNVSTDFINFQLWLAEGTNDIEIHFGPNSVLQPELSYAGESGPNIGLLPGLDVAEDTITRTAYVLGGDPSAPILNEITSLDEETYLDGTIPDGTIYRFSVDTTGTMTMDTTGTMAMDTTGTMAMDTTGTMATDSTGTGDTMDTTTSINDAIKLPVFSIAPNPADNVVRILSDETLATIVQIQLLSINGQIIKRFSSTTRELDVTGLTSGIYGVQLITEEGGSVLKRFVKK